MEATQTEDGYNLDATQSENGYNIESTHSEDGYNLDATQSENGYNVESAQSEDDYNMESTQSEDDHTMDSNQSEYGYITVKTESVDYQNRPFECRFCGNRFNRSAHLKSHLTVHTNERAYTCDECGDKFKQSSALKSHLLIHSGDRPYVCKWCGKSFRTSSTLRKHTFLHTGERPYSCEVCEKTFTQLGALKAHRFTHKPESERPFRCATCNRGFINKSMFKFHIHNKCGDRRIYECRDGERRNYHHYPPLDENLFVENGNQYQCTICNKLFNNKSTLRIHLRIHTGERPYKCELCGRAFTQSNDLKVHLYVHTGERPHKCTLCEKGYTNKGTLNQHMRTHERGPKKQRQYKKPLGTPRVKLIKAKKSGKSNVNADSDAKYNDPTSVLDPENKNCTWSDSEVDLREDSGERNLVKKCSPDIEEHVVDVTPDLEKKKEDSLSTDTEVKIELDSVSYVDNDNSGDV